MNAGQYKSWLCAASMALVLALPTMSSGQSPDSGSSTEITLFQPGQAAWEWLLIPGNHGGAQGLRAGRTCQTCHAGEESIIGNSVTGTPGLEPEPLPGLPGSIALTVAAVIANEQLQMRLSWPDLSGDSPAGSSQHPAQVTVIFTDDALPSARPVTCFAACHTDLPDMGADLGSGLTKYLPNSRTAMTRTGGGENYKDATALAEELENGAFLEYWTVLLDPEAEVEVRDGYVLESRVINEDSVVTADARRENGQWIVEMQRPLTPPGGPRKQLRVGGSYPISFAVHERNTEGRRHFVSFPFMMTVESNFARIESPAQ